MAKIKVTYRFEGDFEVDITIPDEMITEVLVEWAENEELGDEPTEDDIDRAIKELLANDFAGALDYRSDWNVGWDDYTDVDVAEVLVPYDPNKVEQVKGQGDLFFGMEA